MMTVDELLQKPYWIIDILPEQVPADSPGQYPERIAYEMRTRYLYIMLKDSMILSEPDDTHMTVFNPDRETLELLRKLAAGEGLYVWQPSQEQ